MVALVVGCSALLGLVPESSCRPAVDVLFCSAATVYGDRLPCVVLTGTGRHGEKGTQEVHAARGEVIVQDEVNGAVSRSAVVGPLVRAAATAQIGPDARRPGSIESDLPETPR